MSKATLSRNVDQAYFISSPGQATAPNLFIRDQNMPTGNQAMRALNFSYDLTVSGTSTPTRVTNGHLFYLNSLTVETDKHGVLVDNVDGLLLHQMLAYDYGTPPANGAMTSTPADSDTPYSNLCIPFTLRKGIRPYDTDLDVLVARMKVSAQYGPVTNLWTQSSGTPLVVTGLQTMEAKVLPGPLEAIANVKDAETPIYQRYFGQKLDPIAATENRHQTAIPYGNVIYRRIFVGQEVTTTKVRSTAVVVPTAKVSLEINGVPVINNRFFREIQRENKLRYGLENLFTDLAVLDFDEDEQERIFDMLHTITAESGNAYLYTDVVTGSGYALLLGFDCLKEIPAAARRG